MGRRNILKSLLIALICLTLQIKTVSSEEAGQPLLSDSIINAVKKAIRESDEEKEARQAQLISELKSKLDIEAREWIVFYKRGREEELNKLQHADWDLTGLVNYPVPYDYYLRDYDHFVSNVDLKNDSLLSPYKADINISETLYVEGMHSSDATDIRQYYYTLNRSIALSLEYQQGKFITTNAEYGPFQIEPGWQKGQ